MDWLFKILGSKWLLLAMAIGGSVTLPLTWKGFSTSWLLWPGAVFLMNVAWVILCVNRFLVARKLEKSSLREEW